MESQRWGLSLREVGVSGNEYVLRSMMWADNYWLFCHNREKLVHMVNDVFEELLNLDMEPKLDSPWWTSSYEVGGGGKDWDLPFRAVFEVLGNRFQRDVKRHTRGRKRHCELVARRFYLSLEKRFFDNEMPAGDQPCLQHCTQQ